MIEIDGAYGEGGGQILRTAVSLAALTLQPVRVYNIRASRPRPGLKRQHMAGVDLTGQLVDADISGLHEGSKEIVFRPRKRVHGVFKYDIGTAGSISLVLQAVLPAAVRAPDRITLHLRGGTDVSWSPPVDYLREVFVPAVSKMGIRVTMEQHRRGHFPRGGGEVTCVVDPIEHIRPIREERFGKLVSVRGISHCVRLPEHVAERQAKAARKSLKSGGIENVEITIEHYPKESDPHRGPGSGIVLWAEDERGNRIGADALGEKRKSAERVGIEAAEKLLRSLSTGMPVDGHLADMLVPYMAIATGESTTGVAEITSHLETNIWVAQNILGVKADISRNKNGSGTLTLSGQSQTWSED